MPTPPKPNPVRGHRGRPVTLLPAGGRTGGPPPWPLPGRLVAAEREVWAQAWATPQAVAWERLGWTRTVARYCRLLAAAERPGAAAAVLAQATVLEDRLGLTPKSMRLLMWQIATDEVAEQREQSTARRRIRATDPA